MAHLLNNCRRIPSDHDDAGPAPGQREGNASADASRPADDQGSLPGDEAGGNLFTNLLAPDTVNRSAGCAANSWSFGLGVEATWRIS